MNLKEGSRRRINLIVLYFILWNSVALRCAHSSTVFGDAASVELDGDLPIMATAFVQTGNELHYFTDVAYHENLIGSAPVKSVVNSDAEPLLNNQLQFSPKDLSFGEHVIGVPHQQRVEILNPTASSVRFDAISGSTVHFHCSFPEHKTVNPGEATFFDVIFLPRQEGPIENILFIHSSLGTFTYTVRGKGSANPYRIRPLVGARVPLNGTYVSPVQLHNPHPDLLRITEMYTSGGDVHLELPDVAPDSSHSVDLWEIAPYQTKTVMNARMLAAVERNATAYIKIKTDIIKKKKRSEKNNPEDGAEKEMKVIYKDHRDFNESDESLIIPLEVEVTRRKDIFATVDLLDFGLVRLGERSSSLSLNVVSTLEKGIDIESLYVEKTDEPGGIYMEFASKPPISVKSGARQQPGTPVPIAKIIFDSKLIRSPPAEQKMEKYRGRIVADSRGGNYNVSVPYVVTVYSGSLTLSGNDAAFHYLLKPPLSRIISLTNSLPFPVAVWNVTVDSKAQKAFMAKLLARVVILANGETKAVFRLHYLEKKMDGFTSQCTVHTNVTTFTVPIVIFNGMLRIRLYTLDQDQFDFGLLDVGDTRSIHFAITNENPIPVVVKELRNALASVTSLSLLGIEEGNHSVLTGVNTRDWNEVWQPGEDFVLPSRSFAVFKYTLTANTGMYDAPSHGTFTVETEFEKATFEVKYSIEEGTIVSVPEKLKFPSSFPGKTSSHLLQLYSTFKRDMHILRLSTLSHDPRIFFESFSSSAAPVLKAGQLSNLGRVLFVPGATCTDDCYVGMPLHTADGQWFTYGMKLPQNLAEIDSYLYKRMRRKWISLRSKSKQFINATIMVDTTEVKNFPVPVQGELVWPRLLTSSVVNFPLTAVGNFTIVNLTLTNPSSLPVVVQLLPLVIYPDAESLADFFRDELPSPLTEPVEMNETLMFSLRDTELFTLKPDSPVPRLREQLEDVLGIQIPKFTLSMLLQPGMKVRIRVGFLPSDYSLRSSLLLIRNNLTVMEPVVLYGRGARVDMQVEGRSARSRDPLMFDILPIHLTDCHNPKRLVHKLPTTLTVKRSLVINNTGEVSFTIVKMSLNNIPCENRGFKILNCHSFRLAPNESHTIDIAYTPDFLMSWNEANLQFYMHMNGSSWMFPLGASIPRHLLAKCHSALPRPPFESLMYYSCVSALIFCLICVVACAYLEGDRTVTCAIRQHYSQTRRVFNLNTLDSSVACNELSNRISGEHPSPSLRPHVIHYAPDSNVIVRTFWQTANCVLWLFSFVWRFRSDQSLVPTINTKNRPVKGLVVNFNRRSSPTRIRTTSTRGQTISYTTVESLLAKKGTSKKNVNNSQFPGNTKAIDDSATTKNKNRNGSASSKSSEGSPPSHSDDVSGVSLPHVPVSDDALISDRRTEEKAPKGKSDQKSVRDALRKIQKQITEEDDRLKKKQVLVDSEFDERIRGNKKNGFKESHELVNKKNVEKSLLSREYVGSRGGNWNEIDCDKRPTRPKDFENKDLSLSGAASDVHTLFDTKCVESAHHHLSETAYDDRSEAGYSDASAAPEWIDTTPINLAEMNADEEFSLLADATKHLFESHGPVTSEKGAVLSSNKGFHTQHQKRTSRKKFGTRTKTSAESSRSNSCSSVDMPPSTVDCSGTHTNLRKTQRSSLTLTSSNKLRERPVGSKPSTFIQELQRERKLREEQYLKRKKKKEVPYEDWPGFNLKLPSLAENLWDAEFEATNLGTPWRTSQIPSSQWPAAFEGTPNHSIGLNDPAVLRVFDSPQPQIVSENTCSPVDVIINDAEQLDNEAGKGFLDDPLGLSGSLFGMGPTNIWATNVKSDANSFTSSAELGANGEMNSAVYWAESFLRDAEKNNK